MSLYLGGLVTSKSIENLPDLLDLLVREGGEGGFINPGLTLFLNIARIPRITQSDLVFFNLSGASCIFGHVDIKQVTFMHSGGRYVNPNLFQ